MTEVKALSNIQSKSLGKLIKEGETISVEDSVASDWVKANLAEVVVKPGKPSTKEEKTFN